MRSAKALPRHRYRPMKAGLAERSAHGEEFPRHRWIAVVLRGRELQDGAEKIVDVDVLERFDDHTAADTRSGGDEQAAHRSQLRVVAVRAVARCSVRLARRLPRVRRYRPALVQDANNRRDAWIGSVVKS